MKTLFFCLFVLIFIGCNPNAKYEQSVGNINSITKNACATGYVYDFSVADGILTIKHQSPTQKATTYSGKLTELKFTWATLDGDVEAGIDHSVTILCEDGQNQGCLKEESGTAFEKLDIEIKGEDNASVLLDNLDALKGIDKQ